MDKRLIQVVPKEKQIRWQQLELIAFAHYGMNSFTDKEWGDGKVPLDTFCPSNIDTDDWCRSIAEAGAKGLIVTAKHHDGFCLWNTAYTNYSVKNTPWGKDIVKSVAESCKKYGLKFGVYLSPWDRHEPTYGRGKEYDDYFCNQLTELLSRYGEVFEVWFDGACGEGENGRKQYYDWERYYSIIRELQPEAVIAICGEDVRWCGNEAGDCRPSEWSVVPASMIDNEKVFEQSQKEDDAAFREAGMKSTDEDLGSRSKVEGVKHLVWFPAEVDTSIRPGWFYHESEDDKVRPLSVLTDIYLKSVGGNSVLLLNVPPHKEGHIAPQDKARLKEFGAFIRNTFADNLAEEAVVTSEDSSEGHSPQAMLHPDDTYWMGREGASVWTITLDLREEKEFSYIMLMEQIRCSQRIEQFSIRILAEEEWVEAARATTVGYKKICRLDQAVKARYIQIRIEDARVCPTLKFAGIYR